MGVHVLEVCFFFWRFFNASHNGRLNKTVTTSSFIIDDIARFLVGRLSLSTDDITRFLVFRLSWPPTVVDHDRRHGKTYYVVYHVSRRIKALAMSSIMRAEIARLFLCRLSWPSASIIILHPLPTSDSTIKSTYSFNLLIVMHRPPPLFIIQHHPLSSVISHHVWSTIIHPNLCASTFSYQHPPSPFIIHHHPSSATYIRFRHNPPIIVYQLPSASRVTILHQQSSLTIIHRQSSYIIVQHPKLSAISILDPPTPIITRHHPAFSLIIESSRYDRPTSSMTSKIIIHDHPSPSVPPNHHQQCQLSI